MTTYVLSFSEAMAAGPGLAGGKGWNLGRLAYFGFRIPPGCVISVRAYTDFLDQNGLIPEIQGLQSLSADEAASEAAERRLARLRERMESGTLPPGLLSELRTALAEAGVRQGDSLAVRSSATAEDSATASFAGIHRSYLNVVGDSALENAIRGCYSSLWTPTAVSYRRKIGLTDEQVGAALAVQKLIHALYSGIAFTADPVTGRRDRVVINASFGLGEAVVAGSVEADEYHLHIDHTSPVKLVGGRIGLKHHAVRPAIDGGTYTEGVGYADRAEPVLEKAPLELLTRVVRRVQDTLGDGYQPQDVEWCHDGWHLYVTQARPITALPEATFPALAGQPTVWSNANLKDATPGVQTPLGWWFNSLTVEVLLRQIFWRGGNAFPEGLTWSRLHDGRIYMNLSALQWAAYDAFGWSPAETNRALGGHQPEIQVPKAASLLTATGRARLARLSRMGLVLRKAAREADQHFQQVFAWSETFEKRSLPPRAHELELLHRLWEVEKQRREFLPVTMIHNVGGLWSARLAQLLERRFPERGFSLASALLSGSHEITSAEVGYRLVEISRLAQAEPTANAYFAGSGTWAEWQKVLKGTKTHAALTAFLQEFGHRGVYEMELMNPRWAEDPTYLLETIRSHLRDGIPAEDPRRLSRQKRLVAEAEVGRAFRFSPLYRYLLRKAREAMRLREGAKSALVRLIWPARKTALQMGKRLEAKGLLADGNDIFFLTGDELATLLSQQWDGTGLAETVAHRKAQRAHWESLSVPDVLVGDRAVVNLRVGGQPEGLQRVAPGERERANRGTGSDGELQGVAVSSGQAQGPARLIQHPTEGYRLRKGDVLVAPSTDPAWTPLFLRASAVVMEVGGYLSHGAIVAREYGIPAVVNVSGAMSEFREDQPLHVNGDTGVVRPLMSPESASGA